MTKDRVLKEYKDSMKTNKKKKMKKIKPARIMNYRPVIQSTETRVSGMKKLMRIHGKKDESEKSDVKVTW